MNDKGRVTGCAEVEVAERVSEDTRAPQTETTVRVPLFKTERDKIVADAFYVGEKVRCTCVMFKCL